MVGTGGNWPGGGIGSGSGAGRRGRGRRVTEGNKKDSRGREKVRVQYINL